MSSTKEKPKCICPECPSFTECGARAFCFAQVGKSKCIKEEKGCICMTCPVAKEMNFRRVYYCLRGSDEEQKKI